MPATNPTHEQKERNEALLQAVHENALHRQSSSAATALNGLSDLLDTAAGSMMDPAYKALIINDYTENVLRGMRSLGTAMATNPLPASPQMARSLQAAENAWRSIESEFGLLTSTEVAERLGSRKPHRSTAATQRAAGNLVAVMRGNSYRYPGFQFDERGIIRPIIPKLITMAKDNHQTDEDLILWLSSPSSYFREEDRPVDHLEEESRVLAAAADEFAETW